MSASGPQKEMVDDMDVEMKDEVKEPSVEDIYRSLPEEYQKTEEELLQDYTIPEWSPNAYFAASRGIKATPEEQEQHKAEFLEAQMKVAIKKFETQDFSHVHLTDTLPPSKPVQTSIPATIALHTMLEEKSSHFSKKPQGQYSQEDSSSHNLFTQNDGTRSARMLRFSDELSSQFSNKHPLNSQTPGSIQKQLEAIRKQKAHQQSIKNGEFSYKDVAKLSISDAQSNSSNEWTEVKRKGRRRR